MSKDEEPVAKKSFIERMTGTTAQIGALVIALSAVLTQVPAFTKTVREAYCAVVSCRPAAPAAAPSSGPAPAPSPTSAAGPEPATPPEAPAAEAGGKLQALQQAGIDISDADRTWFENDFTPYPFLTDALLGLLQGKHLQRPVKIDVIAWNYEQKAASPRSAAAVDSQVLKTAVVDSYNSAYGAAERDFDKLAQ